MVKLVVRYYSVSLNIQLKSSMVVSNHLSLHSLELYLKVELISSLISFSLIVSNIVIVFGYIYIIERWSYLVCDMVGE